MPEDAMQNLQIIVLDSLFEFIIEILKPRKVQVENTADKFKALKKKKKGGKFPNGVESWHSSAVNKEDCQLRLDNCLHRKSASFNF